MEGNLDKAAMIIDEVHKGFTSPKSNSMETLAKLPNLFTIALSATIKEDTTTHLGHPVLDADGKESCTIASTFGELRSIIAVIG